MSSMGTAAKFKVRDWIPAALNLVAWFAFVGAVLSIISLIWLEIHLQHPYGLVGPTGSSPSLITAILRSLAIVVIIGVGLIILYRSSNWQIGWLLVTLGGGSALFGFSQDYAEYAFLAQPEASLLLKWPAAWFQHSAPPIYFGLIMIVLPQLLPTGRPLSPRWRVVFGLSLAYLALATVLNAFGKGTLENALSPVEITNPYGFISSGQPSKEGTVANGVFILLFFTFSMLAIASLVLRYRRSRGYERQQMKWVAYALITWSTGFILNTIGRGFDLSLIQVPGWTIWHLGIIGFPLAIGFAILKYRLYDIDRIINRTLVYGALTGALALVYFSSVVFLQQVLPSESPIAIVISTLAIATLFFPLRRRIQNAIDRRFYRRKFDAQQTLAAFSIRMRDEVELGRLSETLLAVVEETMQPAHVSLWLKRSVGN